MEECKVCGRGVDTPDGYGYERREGVTYLICHRCLPDWIGAGITGPAGWYFPKRDNPLDYLAAFGRMVLRALHVRGPRSRSRTLQRGR